MAVGLEVNTGSRQEKPLKQRAGWCQYTESSLQVALYNSWDFGGYSWCTLGVNREPASTLTELYIFVAQAAWSSMRMGRHYIPYHSRHPGWYLYFPGYPGQYLYFPGCGPGCAKWIAKVTIVQRLFTAKFSHFVGLWHHRSINSALRWYQLTTSDISCNTGRSKR